MPPCLRSPRRSRPSAPSSPPTIDACGERPGLQALLLSPSSQSAGAVLFAVEQREHLRQSASPTLGAGHFLDTGDHLRSDILRRRPLFPADALRGGEQRRQIAPQLVGYRDGG